ncbi:hypothetical protein NO1_1172 [Candidatus Termititenax aidoneus]|uniref:Antitoxin n=1 Tax=Termititenax aidoneus TaxID=2218524 RepID=A0A388TBT7_TERA1|nr:hypothetical protein NO1_1172 [Candidatus Termititenax aidoneus]
MLISQKHSLQRFYPAGLTIRANYSIIVRIRVHIYMEKKLTLKLDGAVIAQAKHYASRHENSLSGLVEAFFQQLTACPAAKTRQPHSPLVRELSGVISVQDIKNRKKDYTAYLTNKYA